MMLFQTAQLHRTTQGAATPTMKIDFQSLRIDQELQGTRIAILARIDFSPPHLLSVILFSSQQKPLNKITQLLAGRVSENICRVIGSTQRDT